MKHLRLFCRLFCGLLATLALASAGGRPGSFGPPSVAAQGYKLARLYSHVNAGGYRLYKTGSSLPQGLGGGPWKSEGAVCLVAGEPGPGLKPVYQLSKADGDAVRYTYTSNAAALEELTGKLKWTDSGVAFYVAAAQTPDTVPLYRLYKTAGLVVVGPDKGKLARGSDATVLTTDPAVRAKLLGENWRDGHPVGYVWLKAPAPGSAPLPDLSVRQVEAEEFAVRAVVFNGGKANTGGAQLYAHLFLLDKAGRTVFSDGRFVGGMSPGQARPVVFETGGRSLAGLRYQVRVDIADAVKESDESNNATAAAEFRRRLSPVPVSPGHVQPPSIRLAAVQPAPRPERPKRTIYRLAVTNAAAYQPELFQPSQKLPTTPCGTHTDARLLARLHVVRDGQALNAGCKPLRSAADLSSLDVDSVHPLGDGDYLRVTLEDREGGRKYESQPYAVGWFGLDEALGPAGCKYSLGRAGSFICTTDAGMAACEGLRQKGRPIQCARAGKAQD